MTQSTWPFISSASQPPILPPLNLPSSSQLHIYLSVSPSIHPSIHPSTHPSVKTLLYSSFTILQSIHSIHPSIHPSKFPSIWQLNSLSILLSLYFSFGGARDWSQGLIHTKQALYHWAAPLALLFLFFPPNPSIDLFTHHPSVYPLTHQSRCPPLFSFIHSPSVAIYLVPMHCSIHLLICLLFSLFLQFSNIYGTYSTCVSGTEFIL
jgi:hypothetical protein